MAHTVDVSNTEEIQYGECCCCLEEGIHRELTKQYYVGKQPEIYEVMFKDTFNIKLKYPQRVKLICECCIVKLREASYFRTMVDTSQQTLSDRVNWQTGFNHVKAEPSAIVNVIKQESDNQLEESANWSETTFEVINNGIQGTYKRLEELLTDQQLESVKEEPAHLANVECIKQEPDDGTEEANDTDQDSRKRSEVLTRLKLKTLKVRLIRDPAVEQAFSKTLKKMKYSCDVCPYESKFNGNLMRHLSTHTGKKLIQTSKKTYNCNFCPYTTTRREHIATHLNIHLGFKPFSCNLCRFKSTKVINLKDHMRTHTGEKPFACDLCKFRTARKCNLKHHMRTHTGEKPFSCEFCDYRVAVKSTLKQHVRVYHVRERIITKNVSVKKEETDFEVVFL